MCIEKLVVFGFWFFFLSYKLGKHGFATTRLIDLVLWYINHCSLFNAKFSLYIKYDL